MNITKFSVVLFAIFCVTSCNEKIITEMPEGVEYITVTSSVGSQTKAGYDTKTLPAEFKMDIHQGDDKAYNYSVLMCKDGESNIYNESTGKALTWAKADKSYVEVKAMTIPEGVASIDANNSVVSIALAADQTSLDNIEKNDILGATNGNGGITINGNNISVSFRHLMSKLHVVYETADPSVNVSQITLQGVCLSGEYSYANMTYVISNTARGDIQMYLNPAPQYSINAAEAIFYPHTGSPTLAVTTDKGTKQCAIVNGNYDFKGGKNYVMKISVAADGSVTRTSISEENDWVKNVPGGKILWVGTSIPSDVPDYYGVNNNYPQMIENATGLTIINNSRPSAYVSFNPTCTWTDSETATIWKSEGYSLSATTAETDAKYRPVLTDICNKENIDLSVVDQWIDEFKGHSYEELIVPYIDGTIDNCETIIIDHGHNDASSIVHECWCNAFRLDNGAQNGPVQSEIPVGNSWLKSVVNGETTYFDMGDGVFFENRSYFVAMGYVIEQCLAINPNIKIIIGNYFADTTPMFEEWFPTYGGARCCELMILANQAIPVIYKDLADIDIVNVQDYTNITSESDPNWTKFMEYCPDKTHPGSDNTGKLNQIIANAYLNEFSRIFGSSTKTKSSTHAFDYGWEDVELL